MKYVLLVLTLVALAAAPAIASVPDDLQQVSVTIKAGDAQGSGTLVTRQIGEDTVTFIWTAAHVVDGLRTTPHGRHAAGQPPNPRRVPGRRDRPGAAARRPPGGRGQVRLQGRQGQRRRLRRRPGPADGPLQERLSAERLARSFKRTSITSRPSASS